MRKDKQSKNSNDDKKLLNQTTSVLTKKEDNSRKTSIIDYFRIMYMNAWINFSTLTGLRYPGVPHLTGNFFLGKIPHLSNENGMMNLLLDAGKAAENHPSGMCYYWVGTQFVLLITRPRHIKEVLVRNDKNISREASLGLVRRFWGESLVTDSPRLWSKKRQIYKKMFHSSMQNRSHQTTIKKIALDFIEKIKFFNRNPIDIQELFSMFTLRVAIQSALTKKDISDHDLKGILSYLSKLNKTLVNFESIFQSRLPFVIRKYFFKSEAKLIHFQEEMRASIKQLFFDPSEEAIRNSDNFINAIWSFRRRNNVDELLESSPDIFGDTHVALSGVQDGTPETFLFAIKLLSQYPRVQTKLQEEVSYTEDEQYLSENTAQIFYLDLVIKEVQRLFPVSAMIPRDVVTPFVLERLPLSKGDLIMYSPYLTHRLNDIWDNPECFIPERFSKSDLQSTPPYSYIPFGAGPHMCVGQRFALSNLKIFLAEIYRNFHVTVTDNSFDEINLKQGTLQAKEGVTFAKFTPLAPFYTDPRHPYNHKAQQVLQMCQRLEDQTQGPILANTSTPQLADHSLAILVKKYKLLDTSQPSLEKALRMSVMNAFHTDLKFLLQQVQNINAQDSNPSSQKTALHWAAIKEDKTAIEILLKRGGLTDILDASSKTALDYAATFADRGIQALFTAAKERSFFLACHKGNRERVQSFLDQGVNVNVLHQGQFTALLVAINAKHLPIVELLLKKGAIVNQADKDGDTPLTFAITQQDEACVKLLLQQFSDQIDSEVQKACIAIAAGEITQDTVDGAYKYYQVLITVAPASSNFKHNFACYCHLKGDLSNANRYFLEALDLKRKASTLTEYASFLIRRREALVALGMTASPEFYLKEARVVKDNSKISYSKMEAPALDTVLSAELKHVGGKITLIPWVMATWLLVHFYLQEEKNDLAFTLLEELKAYVQSHEEDSIARVLLVHTACLLNDFDLAKALLLRLDKPSGVLLDKIPGAREFLPEIVASQHRVVESSGKRASLAPIVSRDFYAFLQSKKLLLQDMPYDHFEAHFASHAKRAEVQQAYQEFVAGQVSGMAAASAGSLLTAPPSSDRICTPAQFSTSAINASPTIVGLFGASQPASPLAQLLVLTQKQIPELGQIQLIFKTETEAEDCQRQLQDVTQSASAAASASASPTNYAIEAITLIDENEGGASAASAAAAVQENYAITLTKADYNKILRDQTAYDQLVHAFHMEQHRL